MKTSNSETSSLQKTYLYQLTTKTFHDTQSMVLGDQWMLFLKSLFIGFENRLDFNFRAYLPTINLIVKTSKSESNTLEYYIESNKNLSGVNFGDTIEVIRIKKFASQVLLNNNQLINNKLDNQPINKAVISNKETEKSFNCYKICVKDSMKKNFDISDSTIWSIIPGIISNIDKNATVIVSLSPSNKRQHIISKIKTLQNKINATSSSNTSPIISSIFGLKNNKLELEDKLSKLKQRNKDLFCVSIQIVTNEIVVNNDSDDLSKQILTSFWSSYKTKWIIKSVDNINLRPFFKWHSFAPMGYISGLKFSFLDADELAQITKPTINDRESFDVKTSNLNEVQTVNNGTITTHLSNDMSATFLKLSKTDNLSLRQAFQNFIIFGDPGSGKSVGVMANIITSYFNFGFGLIATVFKEEEVNNILSIAEKYNRMDDVIILSPANRWCCNILQDEYNSTKSIKSVLEVITKVNNIIQGGGSSASGDHQFWLDQAQEMFEAALRLVILKGVENLVLSEIEKVILNGIKKASNDSQEPKVDEQADAILDQYYDLAFDKIVEINDKLQNDSVFGSERFEIEEDRDGLLDALKYWQEIIPQVSQKQIQSVMTVVKSLFSRVKNGAIEKLLFADSNDIEKAKTDNFYMDFTLTRKGKIIILNYPKEKYKETGALFQKIAKVIWMDSMQRNKEGQPSVLFSDEYQEFASDYDTQFLSISRSYRVSLLLATQNIPSLKSVFNENKTDKFLANIQTKIFNKTTDISTIDYCQRLVGKRVGDTSSLSLSRSNSESSNSLSQSLSKNQVDIVDQKYLHNLNSNIDFPNYTESVLFSQGTNFEDTKMPVLKIIWKSVFNSQTDLLEKINLIQMRKGNMKDTNMSLGEGRSLINYVQNDVSVEYINLYKAANIMGTGAQFIVNYCNFIVLKYNLEKNNNQLIKQVDDEITINIKSKYWEATYLAQFQ